MSNHFKERLFIIIGTSMSEPSVPNTDKTIVWATCKDWRMEFMPGYIFNRSTMMQNLKDGNIFSIFLSILINIPNTNSFIRKSWEQKLFVNCVPAETISISCMGHQLTHIFLHICQTDFSLSWCNCRYLRIGWTVPYSVYLSIMAYLVFHCNFAPFLMEVRLCFVVTREVNFDLKQLGVFWINIWWCNQGMERGMIFMVFLFRKPLKSEGGPIERVEEQEVIVVRWLFLPDLVLLVDNHLFLFIELFRHIRTILSIISIWKYQSKCKYTDQYSPSILNFPSTKLWNL